MERIDYLGLADCLRITNGEAELVASTVVGPRVLRYALTGSENAFGEFPDKSTSTALGDWKPYAGHRLWVSPELFPATYAPDNAPIAWEAEGELAVRLQQPRDASGIDKQMRVALAERGSGVTVTHTVTNAGLWPVTVAPWSVTALRGGVAVLPREPYRSHDECVEVAQPLALYYFTDLRDPRYTLGRREILLRADAARAEAQKIGLRNKRGWCAHLCAGSLLVKRFGYAEDASYPDYGADNEAFVAGEYMEIELLGERRTLAPGESARLFERWELYPGANVDLRDEEAVWRAVAARVEGGGAASQSVAHAAAKA